MLNCNAMLQELVILIDNNPECVDLDSYRRFIELRKKGNVSL